MPQVAPIADNPSTKKLRDEINTVAPWIIMGKRLGLFKSIDVDVDQLRKEINVFSPLADEFNHYFSEKGWIAYDSFHVPTMEKAVSLAKKGNEKEAEETILDYYRDINLMRIMIIKRGSSVEVFRPRKQLALYALDDYENGRYYSCVLLLLTIIDGVASDISGNYSFFADNSDPTSWDSIAGHSTGLTKLKAIFNQSRRKTRIEEIHTPYRNGILHGRDLNYNNIYVAAKCWGCLAAVLDWGRDVAAGKKQPPLQEQEKPQTLKESIAELWSVIIDYSKTHARNQEFLQRINAWKPRQINLTAIELSNIASSAFDEHSPERVAVEFLELWIKRNYGYMAERVEYNPKYEPKSSHIQRIREIYGTKKLINYRITRLEDIGSILSEIEFQLQIEDEDSTYESQVKFRMCYEGENVISGEPGGIWRIVSGYGNI